MKNSTIYLDCELTTIPNNQQQSPVMAFHGNFCRLCIQGVRRETSGSIKLAPLSSDIWRWHVITMKSKEKRMFPSWPKKKCFYFCFRKTGVPILKSRKLDDLLLFARLPEFPTLQKPFATRTLDPIGSGEGRTPQRPQLGFELRQCDVGTTIYIYIYIYKRGEKNISSCHPLNPVHPYKQRVSIPILWIRNNKKITLKIFKINSSPGYTHTVWQKSVRPLNEGAGLQCSPRIWYCMMRRAGRDCSTFLQSNGWLKNWAMFNIPLWFHFTGWLIALILKILGNIIPDNDQPARVLNTAQLALSTAILTTRPWTWIVCPAGC